MSELSDQAKEQIREIELEPSEHKIQHFSDNNDGMVQFIRFTLKDGYIQ